MSHVAIAIQYAEDVLAGEIPAGKWVKLACARQLRDLERQNTPEFPYYFDEDAAEDVCEFIENLPHVQGKWAVKQRGDDRAHLIHLESWQSFCLTTQFGWKKAADGYRRFRTVFSLLPRKNGKSTLEGAVGLYMLTQDNEPGAEIYCGATRQEQAWKVFKPAWQMVYRDADLRAALGLKVAGTEQNPKSIYHEASGSFFHALIGKPGDGDNPLCAIIDEYHEHDDNTMVAAMEMGMGARQQPMLRIISTAGNDISGPCYQMQLDMQNILQGTVIAEQVFAIIYSADEEDPWDAIETAIKANPNIGVSVLLENVKAEIAEAVRNPLKQADYKTKRLNLWGGSRSPYFNLAGWLALGDEELSIDDFVGQPCWGGSDLASRLDLASSVKVFRRDIDGKTHYYMFGQHYLAEERIDNPDNPNKQYRAWVEEGWLYATEGSVTDLGLIRDNVLADASLFDIQQWGYDPFNAVLWSQELANEGVTMVEIRQIPKYLSGPMKEWQALIEDGRIHHNGDPVLAWAVGNVTAKIDANENVFPRHEKPEMKIDPVVAGIMALGRALADDGGGESIYDKIARERESANA